MAIVTRTSLLNMVNNENPDYVKAVIGRALVAIFNNQTKDEQASNDTRHWNNIGFAGCDAKSGSITAKYFLKHRTLQDWMVDKWTKPWRGYPRICKYHSQLNEIAQKNK